MSRQNSNNNLDLSSLIDMLGGADSPAPSPPPAAPPQSPPPAPLKQSPVSTPFSSRTTAKPPSPAPTAPPMTEAAQEQMLNALFGKLGDFGGSDSGINSETSDDDIGMIQNILIPPEVQAYGRAIAVMEKQIQQLELDFNQKPRELVQQMMPIFEQMLANQITQLEAKQQQLIQVEINQVNNFIVNLEQQIIQINETFFGTKDPDFKALLPQIKGELSQVFIHQLNDFQAQNKMMVSSMLTEVVSGLVRHFSDNLTVLKHDLLEEILTPKIVTLKSDLLAELRPILEELREANIPEEQNISFTVRGIANEV